MCVQRNFMNLLFLYPSPLPQCPVCSGGAYCVGPSNVCLAECSSNDECNISTFTIVFSFFFFFFFTHFFPPPLSPLKGTSPCSICSGDARCHGPDNICGAECSSNDECGKRPPFYFIFNFFISFAIFFPTTSTSGWSCPTCTGSAHCE